MSLTDGATKKSLFIQVRWFNPTDLVEQLEHVRLHHKDPSKDDYIYNVVLDEIGDGSGLATTNLDIIFDYLPGQSKATFNNVFVGSHFVPWGGPGSAYKEGIADSNHRWANLNMQEDLWEAFKARYAGFTNWHFYINHEGVLDYFDIPATRAGYEAYLIQCCRDSHDVLPDRAVLWSPAVWSGVPLTSLEEQKIGQTFAAIDYWAGLYGHDNGINWLHLQDMMGRGRPDITEQDVKQWMAEIAAAHTFDSLRVDMEYFTKDANGNIIPEDPAVIAARENWYEQNGLAVGASWELRHWYPNHTEL